MAQSTTDRNLLFGILALQMDFIKREALITAMKTCVSEKDKPLGQILQSQGDLDKDDDALLDSLVRRLMEREGNAFPRSLAAVTTVTAIRHDLEQIGDCELEFSVGRIGMTPDQTAADSDSSNRGAAGAPSSGGGRFRLLQFHDRGGQGEVWIAEDTELHRDVALKRLRAHCADDPRSRARFVHEAEVTGALEHRGIAPVYSLGKLDDGRPFYAMRFIGGTSLKDEIKSFHAEGASAQDPDARSLELRRLLGRFVDVCNTVAYAHSRGVIHRDLKPGNIILDEYGETLVVDWGLAKSGCPEDEGPSSEPGQHPVSASELPSTMTGATMGTPAFMSPEQAAGTNSEVGPATDVYSLGATLYCLLTGKPPFDGTDQAKIMAKVRTGEFLRPRQASPSVPVALEAICLKAMALRPEGRYSTPRALGEDIERWLADQPVLAYPEPFPDRAARWIRRRKQWVAAAAAMLILTSLGLSIHTFQITREKARTTDQLAMTREALRELLEVSGENLAFVPNTENLRESLARLVLDRYRQLGDRFPTDTGVQLETAQVFRVIGGIERLTGQFAKSLESYANAIKRLTALSENDPGRVDCRRWLVESFIDRGELNHMYGRTTDAGKDFQAAIGHVERLLTRPDPLADHRRAKAAALIDLSEILTLQNQHPEATKTANEAVGLLEPLVAPPTEPRRINRNRWLLAMALTDRAIAWRAEGDDVRAARDFDAAAQVASEVPDDDQFHDDAQFQLASTANQRGEMLHQDRSRLAEADRNFERASAILTRLVSDHKLIAHYREEMAFMHIGRAATRLAMGRIPDADADCKTALDLVSRLIDEQKSKGAPESPQYLSLLGQILTQQSRLQAQEGRPAESRATAAKAAEKLSRAVEIDPARAADKARLDRIKADTAQADG